MSLLSCDAHGRYAAGCAGCNQRAGRYVQRRRLAVLEGRTFSAPTAVCAQWLRELRALGYSKSFLAAEIGCSTASIYKITAGRRGFVTLRMFHRVEATHRKLCDFPGGDVRAARAAARQGWMPPELLPPPDPLAVDGVAVERAVDGKPVPLNRAEITEAWQRLEALGLSVEEISRRLRVSERSVTRWRSGKTRRPHSPRKTA